MVLAWWYVFGFVPLALVLVARWVKGAGDHSFWPKNKDLVRDCIAAASLGIALVGFVQASVTNAALSPEPTFDYKCKAVDGKLFLTVRQLSSRRLEGPLYLEIVPSFVDGAGNSPMPAEIPSKAQNHDFSPNPLQSDTLPLMDLLDRTHPNTVNWLSKNRQYRLQGVAVRVTTSRGDQPSAAVSEARTASCPRLAL